MQNELIPFIRNADQELDVHKLEHRVATASSLLDYHTPSDLQSLISLDIPTDGLGPSGLLSALHPILKYSVNTFSPGFLDKLYAATNAPGIASDLILSVLNTNLHVYQVSPALTVVERHTTKALAALFGLTGPRAGGISVQGGSASNMTSIVIARNTLYPSTKIHGNAHNGRQLVLFTSAHGHYSIEKAAQACGFGSAAVVSVPVNPTTGAMDPSALENCILKAKTQGKTPFYINATAGTTVLGSFDPFSQLSAIANTHNCWLHIDASWGGPFIFSPTLSSRLHGSNLADSIAINPHKMMGVPLTCSFLLAADLRQFHDANTMPAGYLFHGNDHGDAPNGAGGDVNSETGSYAADEWTEPYDLADLTLQCGRRGDSLKLFLSWRYYGSAGYAAQIDHAYSVAASFADLIAMNSDIVLVSSNPPPCLQICFYFAPGRESVFGFEERQLKPPASKGSGRESTSVDMRSLGRCNSLVTERITRNLVAKGFMIDFAPALEGREAEGKFFRVVVNVQTVPETVQVLATEIVALGHLVREQLRQEYASDLKYNGAANGLKDVGGPTIKKNVKKPAERGHGPVVRNR